MTRVKNNQAGFTALLMVVVLVVVGAIGFAAWKITSTDADEKANIQGDTTETTQLSELDASTLAQAKELKKVDLDLDGAVNSADSDDDNDGVNDDVDADDDNDGVNDDVDDDNDEDGVNDEEDDESQQLSDLQKADEDKSGSDND